jgi:hypothetical protein
MQPKRVTTRCSPHLVGLVTIIFIMGVLIEVSMPIFVMSIFRA